MKSDTFKKNIETTFNAVSSRYDENRFFAISASKMAELVPLSGLTNVLDVSTGTGFVAIEVAKKYRLANIEAIDLSVGMLEQAKKKAQEEGLDNITFKHCDVDNIAYPDGLFDMVTCGYALFFYPEMESTYQALCRTIKPGGVLIFSSFTKEAFNPYAEPVVSG
jgi:ubiquinone/menaquinone biosynthesis C-methylase UbiE